LLKGVAASGHTRFIQVISFSNFLLGDVYFRKNEYTAAIDYYLKFLATTKSIDYTGIAALRLGLSYDMLDDAASAKKYYAMSRRGNQDIEDDAYALRKGEILKNRGITKEEKLLLQYSNMTEAGKFREAYKNLKDLVDSTKNERIKAEAYYYLSESAFLMGLMEETQFYALKGAGINTGDDIWINAYCYYNAAKAGRKSGRNNEMMKYIELAEDLNKGDYRNQLKNMLKSLRRNQDI
jgi:tetratricopeptide (TPR) repeat protein